MNQQNFDTSFAVRLASIDLTQVMARVEEQEGLTAEELLFCEDVYRKYLTLVAANPGVSMVPPVAADLVWHAHILYTLQYTADCRMLFGQYLHHTPAGKNEDMSGQFASTTVPAFLAQFGLDLNELVAANCDGTCTNEVMSVATAEYRGESALRAANCGNSKRDLLASASCDGTCRNELLASSDCDNADNPLLATAPCKTIELNAAACKSVQTGPCKSVVLDTSALIAARVADLMKAGDCFTTPLTAPKVSQELLVAAQCA